MPEPFGAAAPTIVALLEPQAIQPDGTLRRCGEPLPFIIRECGVQWGYTQPVKNVHGQEIVPRRRYLSRLVLEFCASPQWPERWEEVYSVSGLPPWEGPKREPVQLDGVYSVAVLQRYDDQDRVRLELAPL